MPTDRVTHAWIHAAALACGLAAAPGCALQHAVRQDGGAPPGVDAPEPPVDGGCPAGQALCSGRCVDPATSARACGASCTDCSALPGVVPAAVSCAAGRCVLAGACAPGRGDCNADPTDGCEADLTVAARCGACGTACSGAAPMCAMTGSGGTARYDCASACSAGMTTCGTSCVDTMTSPGNCGSCGNACMAPANGSVACVGGTCQTACVAGYHMCSGACLSDLALESCGTRCSACPAPANGTAVCTAGACDFTCNAGYMRSGGDCVAAPRNCGNRALDTGETCDDGNTTGGDGCSASCTVEVPETGTCPGPRLHVVGLSSGGGLQLYLGTTAGGGSMFACSSMLGTLASDRVYEIDPAYDGSIHIEVQPAASFDAVLNVRTMCSSPSTELGCIDRMRAGGTEAVTLTGVMSGRRFYVIVDGVMGSTGAYTLTLTPM